MNALHAFPYVVWDDISAAPLDPAKVTEARKLEIEYAEKKLVWRKIARWQAKEKGWEIVPVSKAYDDPIYLTETNFAGESLIYAQAKDSGKYDAILRYPAEDSSYEKEKMDLLGL